MNPAAAGSLSRVITSPHATAAANSKAKAVRLWVCILLKYMIPKLIGDDFRGKIRC
jgi:hypothetical protein